MQVYALRETQILNDNIRNLKVYNKIDIGQLQEPVTHLLLWDRITAEAPEGGLP